VYLFFLVFRLAVCPVACFIALTVSLVHNQVYAWPCAGNCKCGTNLSYEVIKLSVLKKKKKKYMPGPI
jgi:hypothetical protein